MKICTSDHAGNLLFQKTGSPCEWQSRRLGGWQVAVSLGPAAGCFVASHTLTWEKTVFNPESPSIHLPFQKVLKKGMCDLPQVYTSKNLNLQFQAPQSMEQNHCYG